MIKHLIPPRHTLTAVGIQATATGKYRLVAHLIDANGEPKTLRIATYTNRATAEGEAENEAHWANVPYTGLS